MSYPALTRRAVHDLEEIERDSLDQWGERVALEYLGHIEEALRRLKDNPKLLRPKSGISDRFSFYRVREHFLICAQVESNIYVIAVRHGGMDLPSRVAELEPSLVDEVEILHRAFLKSRKKS